MKFRNVKIEKTPAWCWLVAVFATLMVLPAAGFAGSGLTTQDEELTALQKATIAFNKQDWASAAERYQEVVEEEGEIFGLKHVCNVVNLLRFDAADEIVDGLVQSVDCHRQNEPATDDSAVVVVKLGLDSDYRNMIDIAAQ